jgi:GNAT superfamily N-acetyltransferase
MLDPGEPTFGALAFEGDHAIGLVHWILHRSNWTIQGYCYLQDLFVQPESRGRGVGRSLIEHVYSEAQKAGCSRIFSDRGRPGKKAIPPVSLESSRRSCLACRGSPGTKHQSDGVDNGALHIVNAMERVIQGEL